MQGMHGGTVHAKTQTLIYQQNQEFKLVSTNGTQERRFLGLGKSTYFGSHSDQNDLHQVPNVGI